MCVVEMMGFFDAVGVEKQEEEAAAVEVGVTHNLCECDSV
jgi:hypothetical protein